MATQQTQDVFWGNQPSHNTEQTYSTPLNYYDTPYDLSALSVMIPPEAQYVPLPSTGIPSGVSDISSAGWYTSGLERSPGCEARSPSPNLQTFEASYANSGSNQNGSPNGDKASRRRQQNRNSQIAHRQRTKQMIEDLRQEVSEYSEYSQEIYQTLQTLRETTKALVSTIDNALIRPPPMGQRYHDRQRSEFDVERRSSRSSGTGREPRQKR